MEVERVWKKAASKAVDWVGEWDFSKAKAKAA